MNSPPPSEAESGDISLNASEVAPADNVEIPPVEPIQPVDTAEVVPQIGVEPMETQAEREESTANLLESLRAFIQSNVEALAAKQSSSTSKVKSVEDDEQDGSVPASSNLEEEDASEDEYHAAVPEVTILPLSCRTGKGIEECMDWFVEKSIAAAVSTLGGH